MSIFLVGLSECRNDCQIETTSIGNLEFDNVKFEGVSSTFLNVSVIHELSFRNLDLELKESKSIVATNSHNHKFCIRFR